MKTKIKEIVIAIAIFSTVLLQCANAQLGKPVSPSDVAGYQEQINSRNCAPSTIVPPRYLEVLKTSDTITSCIFVARYAGKIYVVTLFQTPTPYGTDDQEVRPVPDDQANSVSGPIWVANSKLVYFFVWGKLHSAVLK